MRSTNEYNSTAVASHTSTAVTRWGKQKRSNKNRGGKVLNLDHRI